MCEEPKSDEPKFAFRRLLDVPGYTQESEVTVNEVWDVVVPEGGPDKSDHLLASNLLGDKATVTKYAEKAFGSVQFHHWALKPAKVKVMAVQIAAIFKELGM